MKNNIYRSTTTAIAEDYQGNVFGVSGKTIAQTVFRVKAAILNKNIKVATIYCADGTVDFFLKDGKVIQHKALDL